MGHFEGTHVVTKILWGCQVAVQVQVKPEFIPTKNNDTTNIRKLLKAELRSLRGKPTASDSDQLESYFSMFVTSDVPLPLEIPTTGQEVKELLSQVPALVRDLNGGKGIPLRYTLTPINLIRKHLGVTVQNTTSVELNKFTLNEIIEVFQQLQSAQAQLHQLSDRIKTYSDSNCISQGTEIKLLELQSKFRNFKSNFTTTVQTSLIQVRSGLEENTVLSDLVEEFWESDYQPQNLRRKVESFNTDLEKFEFCRNFQKSFSHIRYFGATIRTGTGGLINSLAKSENNSQSPIFILFTKFEYVQNEPIKYTNTFGLVLGLLKGNTSRAAFVDCDFPQLFCKDINETSVYKYQNGSISALQIKSPDTIPTCSDSDSEGVCLNGGACTEKDGQIFCECPTGFIGESCEDVECTHPGTCGSPVPKPPSCKCRPGFLKDSQNPGKCNSNPADNNATLLYSDHAGIQQYSIGQSHTTRIVSGSTIYRALDFHYQTQKMFWSTTEKLYSAPVFATASKTLLLTDTGKSGYAFYSIAVDWIHALLYCTDITKNKIYVANLDGSMKKVVINDGLSYPTSIAVNPLNGWMYWVSSSNNKIERAGMDGSRRQTIATTNSERPYGLALDYIENRLYWTTYHPHPCSIYSMNPDGSDLKLVLRAAPPTLSSSSFARITIFENHMYWGSGNKIYRASKCNGEDLTGLISAAEGYKGVQVYHFSKQPEATNQCANRILRCSHLCLPIPGAGNETVSTICACPDDRTLSSDGHSCS